MPSPGSPLWGGWNSRLFSSSLTKLNPRFSDFFHQNSVSTWILKKTNKQTNKKTKKKNTHTHKTQSTHAA